jgi:hypothetical protein
MIIFLILSMLTADEWPLDSEIARRYGEQLEQFQPFALKLERRALQGLREMAAEARRDRLPELKKLTQEVKLREKRIADMESGKLWPDPDLWLLGELAEGKAGMLAGYDDGLFVDEIIDDHSSIISCLIRKPWVPEYSQKFMLSRFSTAKLNRGDKSSLPDLKAVFIVGFVDWKGKRIPVIVPVKAH